MNFCTILNLMIENSCGIKARRKSWKSEYKYIEKRYNTTNNKLIIVRHFTNINWTEYRPDSDDMLATDWEIVNDK